MWEELTIPEKTKVMRFFLQNGISSIDKMKEYYNSASSSNQNTSARKYSGEENIISQPDKINRNNKQAILSYTESPQRITIQQPKNEFEPQLPLRDPLHNKDIVYTMGNWLNNRREQLYNNMRDMYNDGVSQMEDRKIFGLPIFEDTSLLYNNTKNNLVSREIDNQLLRAESAKYKEDFLPLFTSGVYNSENNEVTLSHVTSHSKDYKTDMVKSHEFAHASGWQSPQEYVIAKHFNNDKYKGKDSYLFNPSEIYARLATFRQMFNLDPTKKYSLEDIKDLRKSISEEYNDPYNNEILDPIKDKIHKLKIDYIMKNIPEELRNAWWWKGEKTFKNSLINNKSYTNDIFNKYFNDLPEDLIKTIDNLNKEGENLINKKLKGRSPVEMETKYFDGLQWMNQFSDEDLMFLINDVAQNVVRPQTRNLAAFGGKIYDGTQDTENEYFGSNINSPKVTALSFPYKKESLFEESPYIDRTYEWSNNDIVNLAKVYESFSPIAYVGIKGDILGGYGHKLTPDEINLYWDSNKKGVKKNIPEETINKWLENDIQTATNSVDTIYGNDLPSYIRAAIISLGYQGGNKLIRGGRDANGNLDTNSTWGSPNFEMAVNVYKANPTKENLDAIIEQMQYRDDGDPKNSGLSNRYGLYRAMMEGKADPSKILQYKNEGTFKGYRSNKVKKK